MASEIQLQELKQTEHCIQLSGFESLVHGVTDFGNIHLELTQQVSFFPLLLLVLIRRKGKKKQRAE